MLAHDFRRSEMFRAELKDALQIVDQSDLSPAEMRGAWAGNDNFAVIQQWNKSGVYSRTIAYFANQLDRAP